MAIYKNFIVEELANRSSIDKKLKKLLVLSVESVILERMGMKLVRLPFKEHDIPSLLSETQATARIFLDEMQKSVNFKRLKMQMFQKIIRS